MICYYDRDLCDWDEVLRQAWASLRPGEHGPIIAMPQGCRLSKNGGHVPARQQQAELFGKDTNARSK